SAPSTRERRFVPNNRPSGSQKTAIVRERTRGGQPHPRRPRKKKTPPCRRDQSIQDKPPRNFTQADFCSSRPGTRRVSRNQTSRDCASAASMKPANSGCGSNGLLFSSGWNCTPTNHG